MTERSCRFVIPVGDPPDLMGAPLPHDLVTFVAEEVVPALRPLSVDAYLDGPAAVRGSVAPCSQILRGDDVFWLVSWRPGLVVFRFEPDGTMSMTTIASINPTFGGREASDEELDAYDEDAWDPTYDAVFAAWDAIVEEDTREDAGFEPIDAADAARFEAALAHVNSVHARLDASFAGDAAAHARWLSGCKETQVWRGDAATSSSGEST
jgi:hypothetical protein